MNKLNTQDEIEKAVRDGKQVKWRDGTVVETKAHNFLVNIPINEYKYNSWKLPTVIQIYGVVDFYYE